MRAMTYFRAYKECKSRQLSAKIKLAKIMGMTTPSDYWVLYWQRLVRLELKLEAKLEAILSEN